MFLLEKSNFDIESINKMCLPDFEIYYNKEIEKIVRQQEAIKRQQENKNNGWKL